MGKKLKEEIKITELFRNLFFFSELDEAAIGRLSTVANSQKFNDQETIMLAGDARNTIFFITKGQVRIFSDIKSSRGSILGIMSTGDFFGEIQIFSEIGRNSVTVKAAGECEVIIFRGKEFFNEISKNPKLAMAFIREESRKVSKAYLQTAALSMNTIKRKVISCIMQLVDEFGVQIPHSSETSGIARIKKFPHQRQVAEMTGTTRETVNRVLSALIRNGYLRWEGSDIIVLKELEKELEK